MFTKTTRLTAVFAASLFTITTITACGATTQSAPVVTKTVTATATPLATPAATSEPTFDPSARPDFPDTDTDLANIVYIGRLGWGKSDGSATINGIKIETLDVLREYKVECRGSVTDKNVRVKISNAADGNALEFTWKGMRVQPGDVTGIIPDSSVFTADANNEYLAHQVKGLPQGDIDGDLLKSYPIIADPADAAYSPDKIKSMTLTERKQSDERWKAIGRSDLAGETLYSSFYYTCNMDENS